MSLLAISKWLLFSRRLPFCPLLPLSSLSLCVFEEKASSSNFLESFKRFSYFIIETFPYIFRRHGINSIYLVLFESVKLNWQGRICTSASPYTYNYKYTTIWTVHTCKHKQFVCIPFFSCSLMYSDCTMQMQEYQFKNIFLLQKE